MIEDDDIDRDDDDEEVEIVAGTLNPYLTESPVDGSDVVRLTIGVPDRNTVYNMRTPGGMGLVVNSILECLYKLSQEGVLPGKPRYVQVDIPADQIAEARSARLGPE